MHVGILHLRCPIQAFMRDMVNGLVDAGHRVTLIATDQDDRGIVDLASIRASLEIVPTLRSLYAVYRRLRARLADTIPAEVPLHGPLLRLVVERALRRNGHFDLLIGVEKAGLDFAAWWGQREAIPWVYYSLELYLEDHPRRDEFAWQRARERVCHAGASGTLIQDALRWKALREANGATAQPAFFLPIGAPNQKGPPRLRHEPPFTLLSFGVQGPSRFSDDLVAAAGSWPAELTLWLHGPVFHLATRKLASGPLPRNVDFTTQLVPEREVPALLERADIGLALYRCDYANDRLTAYSSQRVAQYLQYGLPLIAFRNAAYDDLFSRFRCGEAISELRELPHAAHRILLEYERYSEAAQLAFSEIYQLDRYWPELARFLESCATARASHS